MQVVISHVFMDNETYDQIELPASSIERELKFLKGKYGSTYHDFPSRNTWGRASKHSELEVAETEPGIKGDTSSGGTKSAVLETGLSVQVPFFINQGDKLLINTNEGSYVSRA